MKFLALFFSVFLFSTMGFAQTQRFTMEGLNTSISATTADVWSAGGAISFPASATTTLLVSSSANDTAAGTGARTVRVTGLDANFKPIVEIATLNGTSNVTLANSYLRINLVEVVTAGSGLSNAGTISIKQGSTVYRQIPIAANVSQAAVFTTSNINRAWQIRAVRCGIVNGVTGSATFIIWTRKSGGLWFRRWSTAIYGTSYAGQAINLSVPIDLSVGEDVRLEATTTAASTSVVGGIDIVGSTAPL